MEKQKRISVFTDGSCLGNPGPGGYCAIIRRGKEQRTITGSVSHSTNNRMELTAVIEGLSAVPYGSSVTVFIDSGYVERAVNEGRLALWQQNGWRRIKTGEPVKNADRWLDGFEFDGNFDGNFWEKSRKKLEKLIIFQ